MKTTFIVPKDDDRSCPLSQAGFGRVLPPVGLAPMAGLVGRHGAVDLVDERIASARHTFSSDIAVFFINSYNRQRCFELAKLYRQSGSYVVFSGPLLSRDIMEPSNYADSLLQGFGEDYMAEFLSDYKKGKAKCFYRMAWRRHSPVSWFAYGI
jgi:radical SAM superfamily enzyme YgiQ (UPF0313 family)